MNRINREKRKKDFTIIPNVVFKSGLSLRAVGLLTTILQLPNDWVLYKTWLYENLKEGRDAIRAAWSELESAGYIVTVKDGGGKGKLPEITYIVYDYPQKTVDNQCAETRQPETLQPGIPQPETSPLLSTKGQRTNKKSTNKQSTIPLSEDKGAPMPEQAKTRSEKKSNLYQGFIDIYDKWYTAMNGVPPKYDGAAGTAAKSLIQYFQKIVQARAQKDGHPLEGDNLDAKVLEAWAFILNEWHKLDAFLQAKTRLLDINSNIQNIITQIKKANERQQNGVSANGKQATGGGVTNDALARKVTGVAAAFEQRANPGGK